MVGRRRLIRYYAAAFAGAVVFFTLAYDFGMSFFEGRPRTLLHSFEVVMQTFTTTGYGQDAGWGPEMTLLVVWMQFTSLVLIFAAFPIVIVPLVEDALATSPPTALEGVEGHVIVCRHSPRTETLREELAARDVPAVLVEPDRETATDLFERNRRVVHGEPDSVETLRGARVEDALAVVADDDDEVDLSIAMSVGEAAPDVPVYSIVDDPAFETYHRHAGVEEAFSPRTLLGRGLANKITTAVSTELEGGVEIGRDFSIGELPLHPGSALCDQTFAESGLTDRTGARVIGAWSTGEFRTPPFPDLVLDEHTVLLVVGGEKDLERLRELTRSTVRRHRRNEVVIAGYGVVGSTVANALAEAGVPRTVVDVEGKSTVDVVGDATDPEVLREAGIEEGGTVVLALDDDTTTLVATFVIRDLNPHVEVIARADEPESVRKLYRAGADYVLSLSSVTGRLLASRIVGEDVISFGQQIKVIRVPAPEATTLDELEIQPRTGCTVVAVERRDGRVDTDLAGWTEVGEHDNLVLAGTDDDVARYDETFRG
jgi:Trk K+ transport system NAD-binding subunit